MPNAELAGVRAKIEWAKHHFEQVNAAIRSFLRPDELKHGPGKYRWQPEQRILTAYSDRPTPFDPALPLMVGDCIHNLRSALDLLVLQLAAINGKRAKAEKKTVSLPLESSVTVTGQS